MLLAKLRQILISNKDKLLAVSLALNVVFILLLFLYLAIRSSDKHEVKSENKAVSQEAAAGNEHDDSSAIRADINIFANPLGSITIEYIIPLSGIGDKFETYLPAFKYDFPILFNIPVPIGLIATKVENEIIYCRLFNSEDPGLSYDLIYDELRLISGESGLRVELDSLKFQQYDHLQIQISTLNMVRYDSYYFSFSYPITNSLDKSILADINVTSRFTYGIKDYFCEARKFNFAGESLGNLESAQNNQGDLISMQINEVMIGPKDEININLSATSIPFLPAWSRTLFWIGIFGILLFAAIRPSLMLVVNSLKWIYNKMLSMISK